MLPPGIYVPTLCFFDPVTEDLDLNAITKHATRLANSGIAGLAVQGSNGEAVHLSSAERRLVTRTTRAALNAAGRTNMPLIAGCGAQSTRETIALCRDAAADGANFALVLPPAYYGRALITPASGAVMTFFTDVADASPLPVLIYNFPAVAGGTDLDSDTIVALARHPNIVGCKLTCGNVGKLNRVATATRPTSTPTSASVSSEPASSPLPPPPFAVLAGSADFLLPALVAGGHGAIAGLANVAPRACVELMRRWHAGDGRGARELQDVLARADWAAIEGGIVGCKAALREWLGYGGYGRRPLPRAKGEGKVWRGRFEEAIQVEEAL